MVHNSPTHSLTSTTDINLPRHSLPHPHPPHPHHTHPTHPTTSGRARLGEAAAARLAVRRAGVAELLPPLPHHLHRHLPLLEECVRASCLPASLPLCNAACIRMDYPHTHTHTTQQPPQHTHRHTPANYRLPTVADVRARERPQGAQHPMLCIGPAPMPPPPLGEGAAPGAE